ncbi:glycosyl hydrolase family 8 [Nocardioides zeae]|uniref:Glycosyl hydrolase family 8 n=1 Tax=Nocardioides imazamoxiresistens TaxID=3231893 RepID=A0ABU3Q1F9_9ACTN|nr:glycosyl hydrolase family 8 [Nocardioides zeae]MDT9594966.1 glycosyl hydrolase family 8 [Nocardioides zeae]
MSARAAVRTGAPLVSLALAGTLLAGCSDDDDGSAGGPGGVFAPLVEEVDGDTAAAEFLDDYVDDDGRVVRTDQGGDTVSEGQAYALLIALGAGDRSTFGEVWDWTRDNLVRDDGLLSWRWADGEVVDPSAATDADLDAARALVLAGERFDEPAWTEDGVALAEAVLDHATVEVPEGLAVVAGEWATTAPFWFNASYVSPATTDVLGDATGDERWAAVEAGSRAALLSLTEATALPPDWAHVQDDGTAYPVEGPGGQPVQFGYDAARVLLRHAESCEDVDREIAADLVDVLGTGETVAIYDLGGSGTTADRSPLMTTAQAAGLAAAGDTAGATTALRDAVALADEVPTYYGDAWAALAPLMLGDPALGGCAPLAEGDA